MNYQKIIAGLEYHARESAEFLASYPDPDEMESEKAAHRAMVCAVHALRKLMQERGELFRAGEAMRAIVMCYAWDCDEVGAWDAAAQPIRDMLSSPNIASEPRGDNASPL